MMVSQIHHVAVVVRDVERAKEFYRKVFGLESIRRLTQSTSANRGAWFQVGAAELHLQERPEPVKKTDQHLAFITEKLEELVKLAEANGGRSEPAKLIEGFSGRWFIYDIDDNRIELLQK
jgi:catechol 2,3-dioxygenase-like lactoylglutathione lyase family enzyme